MCLAVALSYLATPVSQAFSSEALVPPLTAERERIRADMTFLADDLLEGR